MEMIQNLRLCKLAVVRKRMAGDIGNSGLYLTWNNCPSVVKGKETLRQITV